jgi:mono/diheme cytochrome c family protein
MATTRWRATIVAVALLAILDAARSINARVGYAHPVEIWQPPPATYADLTWPPGTDVPSSAAIGTRIYAQRCAVCHGPDGRGNGPAAPSMIPRPRDFTLGFFKYKSTPPGAPPTDIDLERVVADGLQASAMPYFKDLLSEAEIRAVVGRVKAFSPIFQGPQPAALPIPPRPPASPAAIDRGHALYDAQGCLGCHGADGMKGGYLQDAKNYPVPVRDLSAPWTFRGGSDPEHIWLRITTGLAGSSMPALAYALTPAERWDLVSYIVSFARVAPWDAGGRLAGRGQQADLVRRGEYIVHAEMCGLCHTQINRTGIYRDDAYLAGGMRVGAYPHGVFVSRNLTSDPLSGIGRWSESQIITAFRTGRAPARLLNLWGMPWFWVHYLSDDDATAVARYLKTLTPVRNYVPAPLHYGIAETIVAKLMRPLPAVNPKVLTYADGNFAAPDGRPRSDGRQALLVEAQWIVLALGVVGFIIAAPRSQRFPRTARGWAMGIGVVVAILLLGAAGWVIAELPTLSFIPPDQIISGATGGIPDPDLASLKTPEARALVRRGRYLYTIASCAFCHNPNGAGGQKISWRPFGTLWTRNITSDKRTGIGLWSTVQIARAIRSGIAADGRVLHWQGMIWDHASNWDEEDIRGLVAYVQLLPPIERAIAPARPPAADDCDVYTFWVSDSAVPGCH